MDMEQFGQRYPTAFVHSPAGFRQAILVGSRVARPRLNHRMNVISIHHIKTIHLETCKKGIPSSKDLYRMSTPVYLAQKVGTGVA